MFQIFILAYFIKFQCLNLKNSKTKKVGIFHFNTLIDYRFLLSIFKFIFFDY